MTHSKAILIIGTQRSGSNLLRLMLNHLGHIAAPHPPHILQSFFPVIDTYGDLSNEKTFDSLIEDVCHFVNLNIIYWGFQMQPAKIRGRCRNNSLVEVYKAVYEEFAEVHEAEYWCCKSMANVHYIPQIEAAGLHPFYIHLYRDGRDVSLSFKKVLVGEKHFYHLAKQWTKEQELALAYCEQYASGRFIRVRYEDLIHNPSLEVGKICKALGIEFNPNAFLYYQSEEAHAMAKISSMFRNLDKPVQKQNDHKYLREATREELQIFESIAAPTLQKLGYSLLFKLGEEYVFTDENIKRFDEENSLIKKEIALTESAEEVRKRSLQSTFLKEVVQRNNLHKP
ncbi:MAG: sulfotransferase [Bacteroidetes bacterium]|nr:sulfotransferase [Bacteroidota bacterium]